MEKRIYNLYKNECIVKKIMFKILNWGYNLMVISR